MNILKEARFRLGSARQARYLHEEMERLKSEKDRLRSENRGLKSDLNSSQSQIEEGQKELKRVRGRLRRSKRNELILKNPELQQDRIETFQTLLKTTPGHAFLDLACGHGMFSVAAADMGWQVTGVDARTERMPEDSRIHWVQSDVRDYPIEGFDVIGVLGLFYHLDQPSQMDLLKRCAASGAKLTIMDTRVGTRRNVREDEYEGEHYEEPGETEEERRGKLAASWGNAKSFWPTEESLIQMSRDAGFSLVAPVRPPRRRFRTFYLLYP